MNIWGARVLQTVNTYIVEHNYLAVCYLQMLLSECPLITLHLMEDKILDETLPFDTNRCLLVIDQSFLSFDWRSYSRKLTSCFPYSRLILIGGRECGDQLERVCPDWIVDVVDYSQVKHLSEVVLAAAVRLGQAEVSTADNSPRPRRARDAMFSKRESEVFELVRLQLSNKEIANRLNIAEVTVKFHVSNAFAKMGLRRRRDLLPARSSSDTRLIPQ
jgi:DNA-binding CsgD family transcriptional regulator